MILKPHCFYLSNSTTQLETTDQINIFEYDPYYMHFLTFLYLCQIKNVLSFLLYSYCRVFQAGDLTPERENQTNWGSVFFNDYMFLPIKNNFPFSSYIVIIECCQCSDSSEMEPTIASQ